MMNHEEEESNLHESREEMETLPLDDKSNGHSSSSPSSIIDHHHSSIILDPPSYADAMFTSFDPQSNGHNKPATSSNPTKSGDYYLIISVSDPQLEQETSPTTLVPGGTTYYTYLITTQTNVTEFTEPGQDQESEFTVRRRFKDVVTLSDRLTESHRGLLIPLRPDKNIVESQVMQKQEFVEQRRVSLERYLKRLAAHPVIRRSEELRVFLTVRGRMPLARSVDVASRMLDGAVRLPRQLLGEEASVVDVREMERPASGGRDLVRIWKEMKQYVVNDWGGAKPLVVEEDKGFLERKESMVEFEQHLSNLSKQAESLVKAQQDTGETMGELGLAFVKLTKFETEEALFDSQRVRAADMKNLATAAVKSSRFYRELNSQTVKHLDKLHEYLGIMLAVSNAFSDRSSALLTVQTLSSELASLHSKIEKLEAASSKIFGGDRSRMRKIEELKETVRVTEDAKSCAVREYERIKENNRSELERFDKERHDDFMSMLKGFVVNQAGYAEKMANVWEKFSEETSGYTKDGS